MSEYTAKSESGLHFSLSDQELIFRRMFPNCDVTTDYLKAHNITGVPSKGKESKYSLVFNRKTGWVTENSPRNYGFSSGSIVAAMEAHFHLDKDGAIEKGYELLGSNEREVENRPQPVSTLPRIAGEFVSPARSAPKEIPQTLSRNSPEWALFKAYEYRTVYDQLSHFKLRYEHKTRLSEKGKPATEFRPYCQTIDGHWVKKGPHRSQRIWYGSQRIPTASRAIIVEGEKTADAAQDHYKEWAVLTAENGLQGAKSLPDAQWDLLAGMNEVVLAPDNSSDAVAMCDWVATKLYRAGCSKVTLLVPPEGVFPEWDLYDPLPEGLTYADYLSTRTFIDVPEDSFSSDETAAALPPEYTDLGNAVRLATRHGDDIRYVVEVKNWAVWDGIKWEIDTSGGRIMRKACDTAVAILEEQPRGTDEKAETRHQKFARSSQMLNRLNAMVRLAQHQPDVPICITEFDDNPWLSHHPNGTLNLRTGELLGHNRNNFISNTSAVHYDPAAKCPLWEEKLLEMMDGDEDMVSLLQRAFGYTLTGITSEQVLFFLFGFGANGKSVVTRILQDLLGDNGKSCRTETIMRQRRSSLSDDVARLAGARGVFTHETDKGQHFDEPTLKRLTGADTVTARHLYGKYFDFNPVFKLWISGNHKPTIEGTDDGIWRRVLLIEFPVCFTDEQQDKTLSEKLSRELPGILAWSVRGCLDWQKNGLQVPDKVRMATDEYRSFSDVVGAFIEERCELGEGFAVRARELYVAYDLWAQSNHEEAMSTRVFGETMIARGFKRKRSNGLWYHGIRVKTPM